MSEQKEKISNEDEEKVSGGYYSNGSWNPNYYNKPTPIEVKGHSGKREAISTVKVWQCDVCGAINSTVKPTIVSDPTATDLHICQQCESEGRHKELERKLMEQKVRLQPLADFYHVPREDNTHRFLVNYSGLDMDGLKEALLKVKRLK